MWTYRRLIVMSDFSADYTNFHEILWFRTMNTPYRQYYRDSQISRDQHTWNNMAYFLVAIYNYYASYSHNLLMCSFSRGFEAKKSPDFGQKVGRNVLFLGPLWARFNLISIKVRQKFSWEHLFFIMRSVDSAPQRRFFGFLWTPAGVPTI